MTNASEQLAGREYDCICPAGLADTTPAEVVVDDRERWSGVIEYLRNRRDLRTTIRRLELGDYLVNNRILVERKTIPDLVTSIVDGRLFSQACRMTEGRFIPALIVEGSAGEGDISNMAREAIHGAIVSLTVFLGIPCLRSRDPPETANLLRFTADQMRRRMVRTVYRHGYRPKGVRKRQLFILQGLPGIGPARAERLLDTFGSVEAVFTAAEEQLAAVAGVGGTTAAKIRHLVAPQVDDRTGPRVETSSCVKPTSVEPTRKKERVHLSSVGVPSLQTEETFVPPA